MRFRAEQGFKAPVDVVARAFTEPGFYALLGQLPKLGQPEVLEHRRDGDRVQLAVRYRFTGHVSGAVRRVIDPARLSWVEHSTHDLERLEVELRMVPDHYANRLRFSGRYAFSPDGSGSRRVAEGEVVVTGVPLVGSAVERAIVSGIEEHLAGEVAVVERWVADTG